MPAPAHLFTDADNTLWDTNAIFAGAQLAMLREVEAATGLSAPEAEDRGLAFLRAIDQKIAADHPERLRYPPNLLVRGLFLALLGAEPDAAAQRAPQARMRVPDEGTTVQRFLQRLRDVPPLRPGAGEGLSTLNKAGVPITVVTEERLERCKELLDAHNLRSFITHVVSVRKSADTFRDLRKGALSNHVVMVGDQFDRDIVASHEAGFETFFFPSDFVPYWNTPTEQIADHTIDRYDEIVPFILRTKDRRSRSVLNEH